MLLQRAHTHTHSALRCVHPSLWIHSNRCIAVHGAPSVTGSGRQPAAAADSWRRRAPRRSRVNVTFSISRQDGGVRMMMIHRSFPPTRFISSHTLAPVQNMSAAILLPVFLLLFLLLLLYYVIILTHDYLLVHSVHYLT